MLNLEELKAKRPSLAYYAPVIAISLIVLLLRIVTWPVAVEYPWIIFIPPLFILLYLYGISPNALLLLLSIGISSCLIVLPLLQVYHDPLDDIFIETFMLAAFLMSLVMRQGISSIQELRLNLIKLKTDTGLYPLTKTLDSLDHHLSKITFEQSNGFINAILDSIDSMIAVIDKNGVILAVNEYWKRYAMENNLDPRNSASGTEIGNNYLEVCQAAMASESSGASEALQGIQGVLEGRLPAFHMEYPCNTPAKNQWFNMTVTPLRSDNTGAVITHTNITERKALEQNLAASLMEMEELYENAPCGYDSIGPDSTFLRINATELEWLECKREVVVGKMKPSDFLTPIGRESYNSLFQDLVVNGQLNNKLFDLVGMNGTSRKISLNSKAIKDGDGNFLMSRSVLYDITELKAAENRLQQLSHEQQAMLDNDLVGIMKVRGSHIIWKNKAINRLFGYESDELTGKSILKLFAGGAAFRESYELASNILQHQEVYRSQVAMVRKNGEPLWVDLSGVMLSQDSNESLWILADITQIKKYQDEIEYIAYHDILTGLPNRLLVYDRLNQALAQANRFQHLLAVCYLDLDGFKYVNDNFGHAAGDKLLKEFACRLKASTRAHDTVGRLGGDEFVLLLTHLEYADEYQVSLNRVMEAIRKPVTLDDTHEAIITASIGVTLYPYDSSAPDTLLRHADQAMYKAKKIGRNCVYQFVLENTKNFN